MKKRDQYILKISGSLVEVSEEIYSVYYQMARRAKHLAEKDEQHGVTSYDALDTDELLGEEMIPDKRSEPVEDIAIRALMYEKLHWCLDQLTENERQLIWKLYFQGKSQMDLEKETGVMQQTISYREKQICKKLKKLMEK